MTARAGIQLPQKSGSLTLSNLSTEYYLLHQKKETQTKTNPIPMLGLGFYFFWIISASVFVNWKENSCHILMGQKSGGCLYIIQEVKDWRSFILTWGQQNKVTEEQCGRSSAVHMQANARLHLGASVPAGLGCRCFFHWNLMQVLHAPSCQEGWHLPLSAGIQSLLCKVSCSQATSTPGIVPGTEPVPLTSQHSQTLPRSTARAACPGSGSASWPSEGPLCLSLVLAEAEWVPLLRSRNALHETTSPGITPLCGAAMAWAFLLRAAENEPVKTCRNQQLPWFSRTKLRNWCQGLLHPGVNRWYCSFNVWHSWGIPMVKETSTAEWMNGKTNGFKLI